MTTARQRTVTHAVEHSAPLRLRRPPQQLVDGGRERLAADPLANHPSETTTPVDASAAEN
ncbi:hypothetical protein [Pseudonocardia sp. TRM90224]|uniref:hypothetical protein n=1 Tax=Pseudonocardia sp. TRM90224 TaxID=2812678 RepID=UPI001E335BEA|nr:hypothetical protein [Pseudonocardia sp. TRM90224]